MSRHDPIDRLARRAAAAVADAAHPRVARAPDPDELRVAHGRRRMRQRVAAGVAATAVAVVLVIGATGLLPDRVELWIDDVIGDPSGPEQDDAAGTGPGEWPLGLVIADRQGVLLVPFDAVDEPILLESDRYYEPIGWALPDQRGGLVLQHAVTPPPWPPGAVLWLRSGAAQPELLIPPEAPWEPSTFPQAGILPIGMATTSDGRALFVYAARGHETDDTTIMAADLDAGGALRELAVVDGWIDAMWGRFDATAGGDVVALVDRQREDCLTVPLLHVDDGSRIPTTSTCLPGGPWDFRALSHDGSSLAAVGWPEDVEDPAFDLTVVDVSTGAVVEQATVPVPDDLAGFRLSSSPGGWLLLVETRTAVVLMGLDGSELERIDRSTLSEVGDAGFAYLYHHPFDLASGASLASGSSELPCQPFTGELPVQDLPAPVAATRQLLFDLAAGCDYEGLASLAREHATTVFVSGLGSGLAVGDDDVYLASEDDLVRSWVADGQSGPTYGIWSREPLASLAELLGGPPGYREHAADLRARQPHREGPVWRWRTQWVEAHPEFGTARTDYRVGIMPDGTWAFFMSGDITD